MKHHPHDSSQVTRMRTVTRAAFVAALSASALVPAAAAPPSIRPDRSLALDVGATATLSGNGHIDDDGGPTGRA